MNGDTQRVDGGERRPQLASWTSLFASTTTLVCCALPALLVTVGAGAALSALVSAVPQLVWLSEQKDAIFVAAGAVMAASAWLQWRNRRAPCPIEPALRAACLRTRRMSAVVLGVSVLIYGVGAWFAYLAPLLAA